MSFGTVQVSKKKRNNNDGPNCPHYLLWTKDHRVDWKLNLEENILKHKDFYILQSAHCDTVKKYSLSSIVYTLPCKE